MQIYSRKIHKEIIEPVENTIEDIIIWSRIEELSINPAKPNKKGVATALHQITGEMEK